MNQTSRKANARLRTTVRCALFAAAVILLLPLWPTRQVAVFIPAASPFVTIAASLATRTLAWTAFVGLAVLVVVMIRRRWFCRWACPVGLMTECAGRISPVSPARCKRVPPLGQWLVLLSVSAALVGFPLFLWLDPLAMFSGTIGLSEDFANPSARAAGALLALVLLLSFALPGVWCLKFCPLGATQDLLGRPRRWFGRQRASEAASEEPLIAEPIDRRSLLAGTVGAVCAIAGIPLGLAARQRNDGGDRNVLRPPGAVPNWQFGQLCLRCGNCLRACPSKIIRTEWHGSTWSDWLAPTLSFDRDYCREDCTACTQACPSGALKPVAIDEKKQAIIGVAHVLMDRCLLALGSECRTMCLDSCPYEAITLHEWTWEDDRRYPIVAPEKCPGCGACEAACTPMKAIVVQPLARGGSRSSFLGPSDNS